MQQIVLPSLYEPRRRPVATPVFPLVRRRPASELPKRRARKFFAGVLFGVLMSLTLVLLGYEARIYADQNPETLREVRHAVTGWMR